MMSDNDNASEDLSAVSDDKPLSIAEEIASEVDNDDLEVRERYDLLKQTDTNIAELQKLSMAELIELARSEKIAENAVAEKILSNTLSNLLKHGFRHLKTER